MKRECKTSFKSRSPPLSDSVFSFTPPYSLFKFKGRLERIAKKRALNISAPVFLFSKNLLSLSPFAENFSAPPFLFGPRTGPPTLFKNDKPGFCRYLLQVKSLLPAASGIRPTEVLSSRLSRSSGTGLGAT